MSPISTTHLGRRIVKECFGGSLYQQGRGYYVALELLAILRGHLLEEQGVLPSTDQVPPYRRISHDFARRLAAGSEDFLEGELAVIDPPAREPLRALLSSISVDIPGRRKAPDWILLHLYPYVGELVHYDAVRSRGARVPAIERYSFRGGGAMAHEILRTDADLARLGKNRQGLAELVADSATALGRLAAALQTHDHAVESGPFSGDVDAGVELAHHETDWLDLLRAGVANIVSRQSTPKAQRIEHLMHWVPYCVARHQLDLACDRLQEPAMVQLVDLRGSSSPLRSASRAGLERARWAIIHALRSAAEARLETTAEEELRQALETLLSGSDTWCNGPRAFFTETLAAVGALNATTGRRHFTLHLSILEAIVHATLEPDEEMELDVFLRKLLFGRLRLVVDHRSASAAGLSNDIDLAQFRDNSEEAARALRSLGLLSEFSDATRMVHAEIGR